VLAAFAIEAVVFFFAYQAGKKSFINKRSSKDVVETDEGVN